MRDRSDGSPISATYTARFDGSPTAVTGSGTPYDTISLKQVKYHSSFRLVVSSDGKSITVTGKGTDAEGKPMDLTLVSTKQ